MKWQLWNDVEPIGLGARIYIFSPFDIWDSFESQK